MASGSRDDNSDHTERRLLGEDRWNRRYRIGGRDVYESKLADKEVPISVQDFIAEWKSWSVDEHFEFVRAFGAKSHLTQNEERILEFLLTQDDPRIRAMLALNAAAHSNKAMAFDFLVRQAQSAQSDKGNYFQALAMLGDKRAVSVLRDFYVENIVHINATDQSGDAPQAQDLLMCCVALAKLTQEAEYWDQLRRFQHHENSTIRAHANLLAKIWGESCSDQLRST